MNSGGKWRLDDDFSSPKCSGNNEFLCHGNEIAGVRITCGTVWVRFRLSVIGGLFSGELDLCQKCWRDDAVGAATVGQDTMVGSFTSPPGGNKVDGLLPTSSFGCMCNFWCRGMGFF